MEEDLTPVQQLKKLENIIEVMKNDECGMQDREFKTYLEKLEESIGRYTDGFWSINDVFEEVALLVNNFANWGESR